MKTAHMFTTEGAFFINNVEIHQQLKLFITTMFKIKIHGERGIWMWMFVKVLLLNASSHSYQFVIILSYIFPRRPRSQISKLEKVKRFAGLERLAATPLWLETSFEYWSSTILTFEKYPTHKIADCSFSNLQW